MSLWTCIYLMAALGGPELATEFHALETVAQEKQFVELHKNSSDPATKAYVLTIRIKHLADLGNPYAKWTGFRRYTASLDALATDHPSNIHVRYCRLMVQEQSPGFLGYTDHLASDRLFLKNKLAVVDGTEYMDPYIKANTSL